MKKPFSDDIMDMPIANEPETIANVDQRMPQVKFSDASAEVIHVIPYSETYGVHPSKFVLGKCGKII